MSIGLAHIKLAAAVLLAALLLPAGETSRQIVAAESLIQKGDYRRAVETLSRIVLSAPRSDPEVYMMLAVSKLNLEDTSGALQAAEQGLKLFPDSERIATYYVGLLPSALAVAQVVTRLDGMLAAIPNSAILRKALGKALMVQNRDDPRIESLLSSAATALSRDPEAQYLYGEWACLHQKEDRCIALLKYSLDLSPPGNYAAAVLLNGMIAAAQDRQGNAVEARQAFERAFAAYLNLQPPAAEVPFQFVKFLIAAGDSARASAVNSAILKLNPTFGPAHLEQAKFLFQDGQLERAIEEANIALPLAVRDKTELRAVHVFLVKANSALGREAEAEVNRRWVDANP